MTQAYNLSQLANNLNSSGQLDATDGLVNSVPIANGGTGASSASAARTNLGVAPAAYAVPAGGIIMWSGSVASIPSGWLLCNGASGTPDLRDRFVIGAGNSYAVGSAGGSKDAIVVAHTHSITDPGHVHSTTFNYVSNNPSGPFDSNASGTPNNRFQNGVNSNTTGISINSTGSSGTNANLPPYYALCFIMKT